MTKRRKSQQGFTLIELIVVVTIIGILAGIAIVNVRNAQTKAAENVLRADLTNMRKAIDDFYADKQRYPQSLQELVDQHYMRRLPVDPITKAADWEEVRETEETDSSGSTSSTSPTTDSSGIPAQPGIVDVKSHAEGNTLDGVAYHDL
jgi:general secretion pathway protein G